MDVTLLVVYSLVRSSLICVYGKFPFKGKPCNSICFCAPMCSNLHGHANFFYKILTFPRAKKAKVNGLFYSYRSQTTHEFAGLSEGSF